MGSMVEGLRARARAHQLGGDGRAGVWARNRTRDVHWRWVTRNWRFVTVTVTGAAAAAGLLAYLTPSPFVAGVMVGGIGVGTGAGLAMIVTLVTGTAFRSMGATAEMWTASELRPLRRLGWRIVNHFVLGRTDIDHVLVGPGGVSIVETKWSASSWVMDPPSPKLRDAIAQAQHNAKNLKYWHSLKAAGLTEAATVVFLWGYEDDSRHTRPNHPIVIDGTTVIAGKRSAEAWRDSLGDSHATTTPVQAETYWRAIDKQVRIRDARDAVLEPPKPSLMAIYWQATGALVAALAAVYAFAGALRLGSSLPTGVAISAMAGVGILGRRIKQTRIIAVGWLTAVATCLVAIGCVEAAAIL